jgi:hypothetical protein
VIGVNSWCRDLLEVHENYTESVPDPQIVFLYRSVKDFLSDTKVRQYLQQHLDPDFNEPLSMSRVRLAELKSISTELRKQPRQLHGVVRDVLHHAKRYEERFQEPLGAILDELDMVMVKMSGSSWGHWTNDIGVSGAGYGPGKTSSWSRASGQGNSNFLACAVSFDLRRYVDKSLQARTSRISEAGRPLPDYAIHRTFPEEEHLAATTPDIPVSMVRLLLSHGADPNESAELWEGLTVWQAFLHDCYYSRSGETVESTATAMLDYGADLDCQVIVNKEDEKTYASAESCLANVLGKRKAMEMVLRYRS